MFSVVTLNPTVLGMDIIRRLSGVQITKNLQAVFGLMEAAQKANVLDVEERTVVVYSG